MKKIGIACLCITLFVGTLFIFKKISPQSKSAFATIRLNGEEKVHITEGNEYVEEGFKAYDAKDGDISKKVVITDETDTSKTGIYKRFYTVENSRKQITKVIRTIVVDKKVDLIYQSSYDKIDNTTKGWWSGNKKDGTRPPGGAEAEELKKYGAYFLGPDTKTIYLTFDEGSNDTYVKEIVDALNQNHVKATFFLCKRFILDNPDLIRSMVKNGHSIGNHTAYHKSMPSLATKDNFTKYVKEIKDLEDAYYSVVGKQIDKVYREPKGEWSYRSLQMIKDLGYKSFFYSADYLDWNGTVTKDYALTELKKRVHNGAIYLIHPKNKGNAEAMDSFVKEMKEQGYTFGLVKNIQ